MKSFKTVKYLLVVFFSVCLMPVSSFSGDKLPHWETYAPTATDLAKIKGGTDDPTDLMVTFHPKDILPAEVWNYLKFDMDEMKEQTAEILGFTAPEKVGKIAPEIKPGKYTYQDLEKYPGLKELFPPVFLQRIKAGGPPLPANFMDFEIIPTEQFHWALPACKVTKQNLGKAKLDKDGYIVAKSWEGGIPFPKPSGKYKAQQIYYNFEKKFASWDNCFRLGGKSIGLNKNLKIDARNDFYGSWTTFMGRCLFPPFGFIDKRAKQNGEWSSNGVVLLAPRNRRGTVTLQLRYDDPYTMDPYFVYVPSLRRIRKMASTDTQDPNGDACYDDTSFLAQKITPKKYPYKYDIIEEREYLITYAYGTAKAWVDSKNGYAIRDLQVMRRPTYVLQMTQLDSNYIYSKRIYYIDKEFFTTCWGEYYDQQGRLYRTNFIAYVYFPECGMLTPYGQPSVKLDFIDRHGTMQPTAAVPVNFTRDVTTMKSLIGMGK
jgi:hypothetical protein